MTSQRPVCLDDFEQIARASLPRNIYETIRTGADEEKTLAANRAAFDKFRLRPRVLRNVSGIDLSTTLLGHRIDFPVGISPSAMQCLVHPEGERATARAAAGLGTCMALSTSSSVALEEVKAAAGDSGLLWFQLSIFKNRAITEVLVRRAEAANYAALVVTVDDPVIGRRLTDLRHGYSLPPHIELANFKTLDPALQPKADAKDGFLNASFDTTVTWDDIKWLQGMTALPLILKGILTAEDARIAADMGVAAIFVSNHGGRQLDSAPATIEALSEIVDAVRGRSIEIYLDGGVRTGSDVIKALLLGARAVFLGRSAQWALAYDGEGGVRRMLELIKEECRVVLALLGAASLAQLEPAMITRAANL